MNPADHPGGRAAGSSRQLRRDPRTVAMLLVVPVRAAHAAVVDVRRDQPAAFDRFGPPLLVLFPFIVMFLVTSVDHAARADVRHAGAAAPMPMGKAGPAHRVRPGVRRRRPGAGAARRRARRRPARARRAGPGLAARARRRARRSARHGARDCSSQRVRADRVPGGAVHAGRRAPADAAVRAVRRPRGCRRCCSAVADVLPLSYAVDAMTGDGQRQPASRRPRRATAGRRRPSSWPRWDWVRRRSAPTAGALARARRQHRRTALRPGGRCSAHVARLAGSDRVSELVTRCRSPERSCRGSSPGESDRGGGRRRPRGWSPTGCSATLDHPGRGHRRPCAGGRHRGAYLTLLGGSPRRGLSPGGRGLGQAVRGRAGAARRRREDRARERPHDLPGRAQGRHDGDPRHGGPHHDRLDAARSCASCARTSRRPAR